MRSPNSQHLAKLDHLRFLAAAIVLVYHAYLRPFQDINAFHTRTEVITAIGHAPIVLQPFLALIAEGHTAVGLFLVVSGYIFGHIAAGKNIDAAKFFQNRFLRIYPLFALMLLVSWWLDDKTSFSDVLVSLCMVQGCGVNYFEITPPYWTIAVEMQIYLCFPLFLRYFNRYRRTFAYCLILVSILCLGLIYSLTGSVQECAYGSIFGRVAQFLIGFVLADFFREKEKISSRWLALSSLVVLGFHYVYLSIGGFELTPDSSICIVMPTIEGLVWGMFVVSYMKGAFDLPRTLGLCLTFLGTISYSIYIHHWWVSRALRNLVQPKLFFLSQPAVMQSDVCQYIACLAWAALVVLPVTVLISTGTYYLVELPFIKKRVQYLQDEKLKEASPMAVRKDSLVLMAASGRDRS